MTNALKMIVKMLTHFHMMVYTWWCWHICKEEEVGVDVDQLGEEKKVKVITRCDRTQALRVRSQSNPVFGRAGRPRAPPTD